MQIILMFEMLTQVPPRTAPRRLLAEGRAFRAGAALQFCQLQALLCHPAPFAFAAVLNLGTAADLVSGV